MIFLFRGRCKLRGFSWMVVHYLCYVCVLIIMMCLKVSKVFCWVKGFIIYGNITLKLPDQQSPYIYYIRSNNYWYVTHHNKS